MGLTPVLVGAVGRDFDGYRARLEQAGVDTGFVHLSEELLLTMRRSTSLAVC